MDNLNKEAIERVYIKAYERNIDFMLQDILNDILLKEAKYNNTRGNVHGRMNGVITKKRHDLMLIDTYNHVFA